MNDWIEKIDDLDVCLFEAIPTQTSAEDRRSLLGVQRATARKHKSYAFLEIGSHLGGSILPHLIDDRCERIYSIDPRPLQQPDDRSPGYVACYENNSTKAMIDQLVGLDHGDVAKIECFDLDASEVDPREIATSPHLIFIDGEHTHAAVLSDFKFCSNVVDDGGTILFHDFFYIYPAIQEICSQLRAQHRAHVAVKLEGAVFGIFFDPDLVHADSYLSSLHKRTRVFWMKFRVREWLKQHLPGPLLKVIRGIRDILGMKAVKQGAHADGQLPPLG